MFYDANDIQLSTEVKEVMTEDTAMKYRAWGWNVMEIDGNDCQQIREALDAAKKEDKRPTLIIGKCIMGKGARKADNSLYRISGLRRITPNPEHGTSQITQSNFSIKSSRPLVASFTIAIIFSPIRLA